MADLTVREIVEAALAANPWFGQVINPISRAHGTGGTSSGLATAVAGGLCDFALGTDFGGSKPIRAATSSVATRPHKGAIFDFPDREGEPTTPYRAFDGKPQDNALAPWRHLIFPAAWTLQEPRREHR